MKRLTAMLLALLLVISLTACGSTCKGMPLPKEFEDPSTGTLSPDGVQPPEPTEPSTTATEPDETKPYPAGNYETLAALFQAKRSPDMTGGFDLAIDEAVTADAVFDAPAAVEAPAQAETAASGMGGDADYSGTNVQTAGIDEGDIVKTDGKYFYVLKGGDDLVILSAAGADSTVLSRTHLSSHDSYYDKKEDRGTNRSPVELMLSGSTLAVLYNYYSWHSYELDGRYRYDHTERMELEFYDVSDPAAPVKTATLGQDGDLLTSRLRGSTLYLVSRWYTWDWDIDDPVTFVPRIYAEDEGTLMPAESIYICPESRSTNYLTVGAYDLQSGESLGVRSLLGSGERVYMSADRLYVAGSRYVQNAGEPRTESVYTVTDYTDGNVTDLHCFDLTGGVPVLAASGSVPGYLDSQFSMDEYQGHLRLVTTVDVSRYTIYEDKTYGFRNYYWGDDEAWRSRTTNALYILDSDLNVIGSVEGLAEDERVYSARFDGDVAYFCTFRQVDPLFAVDVSDPTNPVVRSALKISGFSEYLHPWDDKHLFGLGREADETTGWAEEMKLVMFDVTDKTDVLAAHTLRCDCSYSEALYEHKAVFIAPEKSLIGFAADSAYYLYTYEAEAGFRLLTKVHLGDYDWNVRGFYSDGCVYLIGSARAVVLDMDTWQVLARVSLN